jgi:hypothetical protein
MERRIAMNISESRAESIEHLITLHPFAQAFNVVLNEAARARGRRPGKRKLSHMAAELDAAIAAQIGHPLHSVITCFALRICCHFHHQWAEDLESRWEWRRQRMLIDRAWRIISALEEYYGVLELKTLCY